MRRTLVCFTIFLMLSSLIFIACGGSKSGGRAAYVPPPPPAPAPEPEPEPEPAPEPEPEPEPDPTVTILSPSDAEWPVLTPFSARRLVGGTELDMTTEQIRINLVGVTRTANSLLLSDRLGSEDITYYSSFRDNDFQRFRTSCAGANCTANIGGESISISVADFVANFSHPDYLEYQPVMRHNDIPLV